MANFCLPSLLVRQEACTWRSFILRQRPWTLSCEDATPPRSTSYKLNHTSLYIPLPIRLSLSINPAADSMAYEFIWHITGHLSSPKNWVPSPALSSTVALEGFPSQAPVSVCQACAGYESKMCKDWSSPTLILTLECLATKEFDGSSLHGNPKWPGSTVIWQYWNIEIMLVGTLACLKFSYVMIFHESCTRVSMFWQLAVVFLAISLIISKGSRENCQVVVRISWNDSAAPMTRIR